MLLVCVGNAPEHGTPCVLPGARMLDDAVDDFLVCVLLLELGCRSMFDAARDELHRARNGSLACPP